MSEQTTPPPQAPAGSKMLGYGLIGPGESKRFALSMTPPPNTRIVVMSPTRGRKLTVVDRTDTEIQFTNEGNAAAGFVVLLVTERATKVMAALQMFVSAFREEKPT